jgi:hypothetical protein
LDFRQPVPGNSDFRRMLGKIGDHPPVGLLRFLLTQLLVAESDVELGPRAYRPIVREADQDPTEEIDGALQVALDLFLVQPRLVDLFAGLLGGDGRRAAEEKEG